MGEKSLHSSSDISSGIQVISQKRKTIFFKGLNKNRYSDEPQVNPFPAKKETLFIWIIYTAQGSTVHEDKNASPQERFVVQYIWKTVSAKSAS